jgi:medium-chain acyl-[acyl-carrier-protein] hydrolase
MQLTIPMLRADSQACQTYDYVHGPPLDCPLTVVGGLNDKTLTRSELERWGEQTTSACTVRMLPGDHLFINTAQPSILRMVADELSAYTR